VKTYREFGLILKKHHLGEADAIVTLLTRQEGIVRAVAKGVKRMTSKKGGNLELFNEVDVLLSQGKSLDVLVEATAIDAFGSWREDLIRVSQCYYLADLTLMVLPEGESYPVVYDHLTSVFSWLGHATDPSLLVRWYEVQLLSDLGFWASGQLTSESINAVALLDGFVGQSVEQAASLRSSERLSFELERLMRDRLSHVLERDVPAQQFVYQVRALDQSLGNSAFGVGS
jgi:DNA repair protein RecO